MEYIDSTSLITTLPLMAAYFGVKSNMMSIGITVYMISLAVFIPVSGWVATSMARVKCSSMQCWDLSIHQPIPTQ
ncbi:hypothetical protein [Prevotella nigrescens]|uniref:hypothetical protein n=1 Tax=Prevotella nigrescens TaxID=28133 RepID=UPI001E30DE2E|nr:hypothetical protein [Prevotella nigrescens]